MQCYVACCHCIPSELTVGTGAQKVRETAAVQQQQLVGTAEAGSQDRKSHGWMAKRSPPPPASASACGAMCRAAAAAAATTDGRHPGTPSFPIRLFFQTYVYPIPIIEFSGMQLCSTDYIKDPLGIFLKARAVGTVGARGQSHLIQIFQKQNLLFNRFWISTCPPRFSGFPTALKANTT